MDEERLRAEALRVYHRYATEVVEPLNLCPWARRARLDGRVTHRVVLHESPTPEELLPEVDAVAARPDIDVGLLLLPLLCAGPEEHRRLVAGLRAADAARHGASGPALYMADFHPHAALDPGSPARLVPFIRRTPDPTIQLVRRAVLEEARKNDQGGTVFASHAELLTTDWRSRPAAALHERIAEANHQAAHAYGMSRLDDLLTEIQHDRDRAYARAGLLIARPPTRS